METLIVQARWTSFLKLAFEIVKELKRWIRCKRSDDK